MPKISIIIFLLELVSLNQLSIPFISQPFLNSLLTYNFSEVLPLLQNLFMFFPVQDIDYPLISPWVVVTKILLISSLLSLIIGTVVGLAQIRIKRLLAYSTITHVGFLLLALSINTEQSTESLFLYLIQYIITSLNTFFILLAFGYLLNRTYSNIENYFEDENKKIYNNLINLKNEKGYGLRSSQYFSVEPKVSVNSERDRPSDINFIFDLKGQFVENPLLSISFAICLFSMAGVPPLLGFFGKLSVLTSAIGNGYTFICLLAIILSVISAYYYLRIITELYSENKPSHPKFNKNQNLNIENKNDYKLQNSNKKNNIENNLILTNLHSFIIATCTLIILFFVLKPSIILNSTVLLSLSLFNG